MKAIKFIEVKSELGAGTRGASMGVDALKIAALDYGSTVFKRIESIEVKTETRETIKTIITTFSEGYLGLSFEEERSKVRELR